MVGRPASIGHAVAVGRTDAHLVGTGACDSDCTLNTALRRGNIVEIADLSEIEGRARPACLKRAGHIDPDGECLSQDHPKLDPIHTSHSVADISYIKGKGSPRGPHDPRRDPNELARWSGRDSGCQEGR